MIEKALADFVKESPWVLCSLILGIILGLYFLWSQKKAISDAIRRTTGIEKIGLSMESSTPQPQKDATNDIISQIKSIDKNGPIESNTSQPQNDEEKKKQVAQDLCNQLHKRHVFTEREEKIRQELKEKELGPTDDSVAKLLIEHLAAYQVAVDLEQVYCFIFGSQIELLKTFNEFGPAPLDYLETHHEKAKGISGNENTTKDGYFSFLFNRKLIKQEEDKVYITNLGREFLLWMVYSQRSENRPR